MTAIDTDVGAVQRMFDINVFGPMRLDFSLVVIQTTSQIYNNQSRMVRHFHDLIIEAKGVIVNIGSIGGVIPYLYGCKYSELYFGLQIRILTN